MDNELKPAQKVPRGCDIRFSLMSMVDDFGRVFFSAGKVYRAIENNKKEYCLSLLKSDLFKELSEKGMVPFTKISDFKLEEYDLILEHEKLLETIPYEWTFSMLKDAAIAICEINVICNKYGFELKDAHVYNILFRGTQPVLIDIGSISPKTSPGNSWNAYEDYLGSFMIPLLFWSENKFYIAHKLLESIDHAIMTIPNQSLKDSGLLELLELTKVPYQFKVRSKRIFSTDNKSDILSYIDQKTTAAVKRILKRNIKVFSYEGGLDKLKRLSEVFPYKESRNLLNTLPVPTIKSRWQNYHQDYFENNINDYTQRFKSILRIINGLKEIHTIIDLAGNEGFFSNILYNEINCQRLIIADYDENAIDAAYSRFKRLDASNVYTLLLNFMYTTNQEGTAERLKSDLVLAFAVCHHLVLTSNYSLNAIFERLVLYSKKYVMVEFMPLGLWSSENENNYPAIPEWYTINWFRSVFEKYFNLILEEKIEKNRVVFLGEVNNLQIIKAL
jgi:hypothetical protein